MNNSSTGDPFGMNDISDAEIYFNAVFLSIVMVTTIVGNALALHAFFKSPELKEITYYFIASLCISDLLVAVFSISLWIIDVLNRWGVNIPNEFRIIYGCVDIFGGTWSIMSLAFISIERYICIKHSLHYSYIMTLPRVYILFGILLIYCSVVTFLNTREFTDYSHEHVIKQSVIVFMAYVLPVIIKVFTYSEIYREAKRQSQQINQLRQYTSRLSDNSHGTRSSETISLRGDKMAGNGDSKRSFGDSKRSFVGKNNYTDILIRYVCICHDRISKSDSTEYLQYKRGTSTDSNGTNSDTPTKVGDAPTKVRSETIEILDPITEQLDDVTNCQQVNETEFNKEETGNQCTQRPPKRPKLTTAKSMDASSTRDECREYRQACRTYSSDGYKCAVRQNLDPSSALEDNDNNKYRSGSHSESPLRTRLRTLTKWSPATSPLIVRKFNKKSSEHKRNEQKIRRFKKELRAAKVVGLIMGTFLICWTPFNALMLMYALHVQVVMRHIMLAKLLHYLNSAINPILYVVLNKVYRTAVVKVLKKFKPFSERW